MVNQESHAYIEVLVMLIFLNLSTFPHLCTDTCMCMCIGHFERYKCTYLVFH